MKGVYGPIPVITSMGLLAAAAVGIRGTLGAGSPVLAGTLAGLLLGWAGSAVELRFLLPHLRSDLARASRILTAGFGIRLIVILLGMTALERSGLADGNAFAIGVVGGFLAFLPVLSAAAKSQIRNGGAQG